MPKTTVHGGATNAEDVPLVIVQEPIVLNDPPAEPEPEPEPVAPVKKAPGRKA